MAAAMRDGTFLKTPNGLDSRQWLQMRTKAFTDWFGDWKSVADNLIYGSDFRFVEHVANHHAEVCDYAAYVDNMLDAFANPEKVFLTQETSRMYLLRVNTRTS